MCKIKIFCKDNVKLNKFVKTYATKSPPKYFAYQSVQFNFKVYQFNLLIIIYASLRYKNDINLIAW